MVISLSEGNPDENQPAKYTEIQVNQVTDTSEGFLPPIKTTGMYSMVHWGWQSWKQKKFIRNPYKYSLMRESHH